VDFAPDEDRTIVRKALLRNHRATLGEYIFDGTVMYSSVRFPQDVSNFHNYFSSIISAEIIAVLFYWLPLFPLCQLFDDISLILFLFCLVVDKI
jgi:hypothetical protein